MAKKVTVTENGKHLRIIDVTWSRYSIESLFLEPATLGGWLLPHLDPYLDPADGDALRSTIAEAVRAADQEESLIDDAVDGRLSFHRRPDANHKISDEKTALAAARADVRKDPAVWQHGKQRAKFVLTRVRESLGRAAHPIRGGLTDLIRDAATDSLGDPTVVVPDEIRAFLDAMVAG